jgi:hypothetical protein
MHTTLRNTAAGLTLALGLAGPASAIVINDTAGAATAIALGTGNPGIVDLNLGGGGCSGALISASHILTAQHCTFGTAPAAMTINFHDVNNDGVPDNSLAVTAKAEMNATNVLLDGTDLAVLTFTPTAATNAITPFSLFDGSSSLLGATVDMFGFGFNGLGSVGHGGTADGLQWGAENVLDAIGPAFNFSGAAIGGTADILNTDFDDGSPGANVLSTQGSSATPLTNEGTTAPGDSGGPLIASGLIAGALSGGTTATSVFGDVSWWTSTFSSAAQAFITAATGGAAIFTGLGGTITPEPMTLVLVLAGGLAVSSFGRRSQARPPAI